MFSFEENEKTEKTIHDIEEAIQSTNDQSIQGMLYKAAGDAYYSGLRQAPKDEAQALEYYKAGMDCGNVECMYKCGMYNVMNYWGKDKTIFSAGVYQLCKSYTLGHEPAKQPLEDLINDGMFPGCNSINDLQELLGLSKKSGSAEPKMPYNSNYYFDSSVKPKVSYSAMEKQLKREYLGIIAGVIGIIYGILWLSTESKYSDTYEAGYWFIGGSFLILFATIAMIAYLKDQLAKASSEKNDWISIRDKEISGYGFVCRSGSTRKGPFSISVDDLCGATLSADGGVNIEVKDGNIFCQKLEDSQAAVFVLSKLASSNKDNSL